MSRVNKKQENRPFVTSRDQNLRALSTIGDLDPSRLRRQTEPTATLSYSFNTLHLVYNSGRERSISYTDSIVSTVQNNIESFHPHNTIYEIKP